MDYHNYKSYSKILLKALGQKAYNNYDVKINTFQNING